MWLGHKSQRIHQLEDVVAGSPAILHFLVRLCDGISRLRCPNLNLSVKQTFVASWYRVRGKDEAFCKKLFYPNAAEAVVIVWEVRYIPLSLTF